MTRKWTVSDEVWLLSGTNVMLVPSCKRDRWQTPGGGEFGWWCVKMDTATNIAYAPGLKAAKALAESLLKWKVGK